MVAPDAPPRTDGPILDAIATALPTPSSVVVSRPRLISPGVAEVGIAATELPAARAALARAGFAPLGGTGPGGAIRFLGYLPRDGGWGEVRIKREAQGRARQHSLRDRIPRPLRRRGLGVALLGPDGAGKSTLVAIVADRFPMPVRCIYMGLYQGEDEAKPRSRFRIPGVGLAGNLLRQQARWLRGAWHRARGRLVLFDRYTYDALLPADRPLSAAGRLRRSLMARACPAPDLVVVLDAPPTVLFARKGEHDPELLETHRNRFRGLQTQLPGSLLLDTSAEPDISARELIGAIWSLYARRWQ